MEYIIVILAAVAATTLIVYKLGNRLTGVTLHIKSLILCAVCALFISLILPKIVVDFAGLSGSVIFLLFFAIVFAYFIAQYDASCKSTQPTDLMGADVLPESCMHIGISIQDGANSQPTAPLLSYIEQQTTETCSHNEPGAVSIDIAEQQVPGRSIKEEIEEIAVVPSENQQENSGEHYVEEVAEEVKKAEDPTIALVKGLEEPESAELQAAATSTSSMACDNSIAPGYHTFAKSQEATLTAPTNSLEELMEIAYQEKEQKNFNQALIIFRQALTQYPNDDSAPFLTVEIGNILKNKGLYDEAIQVFSDGRNLSGLRSDPLLEQEFISTIAYLRIIKNTLLQHRLGFIPFNNIPEAIMNEINAEFREWRNLS